VALNWLSKKILSGTTKEDEYASIDKSVSAGYINFGGKLVFLRDGEGKHEDASAMRDLCKGFDFR
jgi:hypothetical protein